MNILMVCDAFPPQCGGAGWDAFYLVKALQREHTVTVVSISGQSDEFEGIRVHRVKTPWGKEFAYLSLRKFLKKLLSDQHFDAINAHEATPIRASVGLGVPVIGSVHDYWPICYKGTLFNRHLKTHYEMQTVMTCFKSVFFENGVWVKIFSLPIAMYMLYRTYASRKALQESDVIATASRYIYEKIKQVLPGKPWGVLYPICAIAEYEKVPVKKFSRPTVVFVGKFNVNKGATLVPKIAELLPEVDFLMIGGTKEQLSIEIPQNVTIINYIPNQEVFSYLKSCDIFIAPALWHEPLGRTIMEAMAMGTAPIVSDRGGMQLELVESEKNGVIVKDPITPERFAEEIRSLLKDQSRRQRLKVAARESFLEKFNEDVVFSQFTDLLSKIKRVPEEKTG